MKALNENEKQMSISDKSIHVMLIMNMLTRIIRGINHSNIEVIRTMVIEPLYELGQTRQNKDILTTLENYEKFYNRHLVSMTNRMGNAIERMNSF